MMSILPLPAPSALWARKSLHFIPCLHDKRSARMRQSNDEARPVLAGIRATGFDASRSARGTYLDPCRLFAAGEAVLPGYLRGRGGTQHLRASNNLPKIACIRAENRDNSAVVPI